MVNLRNIPIKGKGHFSTSINLAPGHAEEYIFFVKHQTGEIRLDITDLNLGVDLGLNSLEVYIQSAKRTTYAYFVDSANVWDDASFVVTDDETTWSGDVTGVFMDPFTRLAPIERGYVKVVIENDWTSFDTISADIDITVMKEHKSHRCHHGYKKCSYKGGGVKTGEVDSFDIRVPGWATGATVQLKWLRDWSRYPTSDLDMVMFWTDDGTPDVGFAATLNSPERFVISGTDLEDLTIVVLGYWVKPPRSEPYLVKVCFEK